ncbi:cell division protein FtsZ [Deferribacterales bacterium RsTz2092]|nr:cell division protein FtsZ [Deferribacterales bacterium]
MDYNTDIRFNKSPKGADIRVVGVGGCGGNAIINMIAAGVQHVGFIAANTDAQDLEKNTANIDKILLGKDITHGRGAGMDPEVGKKTALATSELISETMSGADMIFITAGMGKGTGTGASPVIAAIAKDLDALVVAVIVMPMKYMGKPILAKAELGLKELIEHVDSYIVLDADRIVDVIDKNATVKQAFEIIDNVLVQAVKCISETVHNIGHINSDFNDIKTIMLSQGPALMGMGTATGDNRAKEAFEKALKSPLLADCDISSAHGALLAVTAAEDDFRFIEFTDIMGLLQENVGENTIVSQSLVFDARTDGSITVSLIVTGIKKMNTHRSSEVISLIDYKKGKKKDNNIIVNNMQKITKLNKDIQSFDDYNTDEAGNLPTYLRKQLD